MLEALQAAIAALSTHEAQCTERWQTAQKQFEVAKTAEYAARCAMQDSATLREEMERYLKTLKPEGQQ